MNYSDLNTDLDSVTVGVNVHITAEVEKYDSVSGLFYLKPISVIGKWWKQKILNEKGRETGLFCILRWYKETGFQFREIESIFEVPKKVISQNDVDQIKEIRITFF